MFESSSANPEPNFKYAKIGPSLWSVMDDFEGQDFQLPEMQYRTMAVYSAAAAAGIPASPSYFGATPRQISSDTQNTELSSMSGQAGFALRFCQSRRSVICRRIPRSTRCLRPAT